MSTITNKSYCDTPFTEEFSQVDFFTHYNIKDLINKCNQNKESIIKFRTIGIIESINGNFFVKDLNASGKVVPSVLVSMVYIKKPLKNNILPYTAQRFGTIQWKNIPIIYANIIQELTVANAIRVNDAVSTITKSHLANT